MKFLNFNLILESSPPDLASFLASVLSPFPPRLKAVCFPCSASFTALFNQSLLLGNTQMFHMFWWGWLCLIMKNVGLEGIYHLSSRPAELLKTFQSVLSRTPWSSSTAVSVHISTIPVASFPLLRSGKLRRGWATDIYPPLTELYNRPIVLFSLLGQEYIGKSCSLISVYNDWSHQGLEEGHQERGSLCVTLLRVFTAFFVYVDNSNKYVGQIKELHRYRQ